MLNKSLSRSFHNQAPTYHTCGFYEDEEERMQMLACYYKEGLARNELCIFVTDQKPSDLIKDLKAYGLDIGPAYKKGDFKVFPTKPTYLEDGTFSSARMLDNLKAFVKEALAMGYKGVRGGGDMYWLADKPPGWRSIGEYEAKINSFARANKFTGICLFPMHLLDANYTQLIIMTHQHMVRAGGLHDNPYYEPMEVIKGINQEIIDNLSQIENWLAKIDAKKAVTASA